MLSGLSFLICSLQASDSTCCSPKVFPGDIWSQATCLERFLFLGASLGSAWSLAVAGGGEKTLAWKVLCGSYVALWQCPFDCALARGAGPSQIRENSRMCLFTHRPCLGVWVRRVCWDPVPTNPGFPLASPDCVPFPVKGSGGDWADP